MGDARADNPIVFDARPLPALRKALGVTASDIATAMFITPERVREFESLCQRQDDLNAYRDWVCEQAHSQPQDSLYGLPWLRRKLHIGQKDVVKGTGLATGAVSTIEQAVLSPDFVAAYITALIELAESARKAWVRKGRQAIEELDEEPQKSESPSV